MLSVRSRLTAWNAGIITAVLLAFASAAYALLKHAAIEQVDQVVRQQLRAVTFALGASAITSANANAAVPLLAKELRSRGYKVTLAPAASVVMTRALRSGRAELELREGTAAASPNADTVTPGALRAIVAQASSGNEGVRREPFTVGDANGGVRMVVKDTAFGGARLLLVATEPLDEVDELLEQVRVALFVAIPMVAAIGLIVGYWQARNALAPVSAMTAQARQMSARHLHERLVVKNPDDELGQLAATFNSVLDRVDHAMDQQHQFTANASHELRTPIAIIRSEADVTLDGADRSAVEYRESLEVIRQGSEQLSTIVNDLFILARADAGEPLAQSVPMYLDDLAFDAVRSMRALAAARNIEIAMSAPEGAAFVGDEKLLRQALINLLDNAIKYSPEFSEIAVTIEQLLRGFRLGVADTGMSIPDDVKPLVFNRFFRVNTVRSSDVTVHGSGAGLGLAIAREIVELHGGKLTLRDTDPRAQRGSTFEMWLPTS